MVNKIPFVVNCLHVDLDGTRTSSRRRTRWMNPWQSIIPLEAQGWRRSRRWTVKKDVCGWFDWVSVSFGFQTDRQPSTTRRIRRRGGTKHTHSSLKSLISSTVFPHRPSSCSPVDWGQDVPCYPTREIMKYTAPVAAATANYAKTH